MDENNRGIGELAGPVFEISLSSSQLALDLRIIKIMKHSPPAMEFVMEVSIRVAKKKS